MRRRDELDPEAHPKSENLVIALFNPKSTPPLTSIGQEIQTTLSLWPMSAAPRSPRCDSGPGISFPVSGRVSFGAPWKMSLVSHCVKRFHTNKSNFSIDHILNVAGRRQNLENFDFSKHVANEDKKFDWLSCTRYRPPKLPRQRKKEGIQRRKLGRNPRIPFSSSQVAFLEAKFLRTPYLSSTDVTQLASYLKLSETRVKIWFQNRRARERRERDTKSKGEENSLQSATKMDSPSSHPTAVFPLDPPKCFSLECGNSFRCVTYAHSGNSLQVVSPLDLSERSTVYRPK